MSKISTDYELAFSRERIKRTSETIFDGNSNDAQVEISLLVMLNCSDSCHIYGCKLTITTLNLKCRLDSVIAMISSLNVGS